MIKFDVGTHNYGTDFSAFLLLLAGKISFLSLSSKNNTYKYLINLKVKKKREKVCLSVIFNLKEYILFNFHRKFKIWNTLYRSITQKLCAKFHSQMLQDSSDRFILSMTNYEKIHFEINKNKVLVSMADVGSEGDGADWQYDITIVVSADEIILVN